MSPRLLFTACLLLATPAAALAQDSDGDGAIDPADAYPCDPQLSGASFAPAEGVFGQIAFEDRWPAAGDLDFNDLVLAYNVVYRLAPGGRVAALTLTLDPRAVGGSLDMGLGLRLAVPRTSVAQVTRRIGAQSAQVVAPSTADSDLTVRLSPNLRELFDSTAGPINSRNTEARRTGQRMIVEVTFASPVTLSSAAAPHDLFIFRSDRPQHEIHRPEFGGTSAMDLALFGTWYDGSTQERQFVDRDGMPFALVFPELIDHPREAVGIAEMFPDIIKFAQSGGTSDRGFYQSNVVTTAAYRDVNGLAAPVPGALAVPVIDRSCLAQTVAIRAATTITSANLATYAGSALVIDNNAVVTVDVDTPIDLYSLTINSGRLTHSTCTTARCTRLHLRVTADVTIGAGGSISADGAGYLGSSNSGNGAYGRTFGNVYASTEYYNGGSHGGWAGRYNTTVTPPYGSVLQPSAHGAGGTAYPGYVGGNGGGVVHLEIGGNLVLNGVISADGNGGPSGYAGGAGGSIRIEADRILRSGSGVAIRANGASGVIFGAGGGGRIALAQRDEASLAVQPAVVQAYGGASNSAGRHGGSGTVLYRGPGEQIGTLLMAQPSGRASAAGDTFVGVSGNVTSVSATVLGVSQPLVAGSLVGRTVRPDADGTATFVISANTASSITVAGNLSGTTAAGRRFVVTDHENDYEEVIVRDAMTVDTGELRASRRISVAGNATLNLFTLATDRLELTDAAVLNVYDASATTFTLANTSRATLRSVFATDVELGGSAVLTGWGASTAATFQLGVTADRLTVGPSARITTDGLGYLGSSNAGNGAYGRTLGNVYASSEYYNGGSHGGFAGRYNTTIPMIYGAVEAPVHPGGGGTAYPGYVGGNGGGVIRLDIADRLTVDGLVSADGSVGPSSYAGGAGGSIWVTAGTISRNVSGLLFRANGASGVIFGAGGGGRIALEYDRLEGWAIGASAVQAYGGASNSAGRHGGSGTIYYRPRSQDRGSLLFTTPSGRNATAMDTRIGAFGIVTSVSATTLGTSDPLVPNTLAGRTLQPNIDDPRTFTIVSNTASAITVAGGLSGTTVAGARFSVLDYQTQFEDVTIEGDIDVDTGYLDVRSRLEVRGPTSLDAHDVLAGTFAVRDSAQIFLRQADADLIDFGGTSLVRLQNLRAGRADLTGSTQLVGWLPATSRIYGLDVAADEFSLASTARISMDGLGYLGSSASGNGAYGRTLGNVYATTEYYNGGSHGGYAGRYNPTVTAPYGDILRPVSAGAGGTAYPGYVGGNGGGTLRLVVPGTLALDGLISADGTAGPSAYAGGAGGSIWITAGTISRAQPGVALRANGASGVIFGAGAGGRIAVEYGALSGWAVTSATAQAHGGASNNAGRHGGSGTVHHRQSDAALGQLILHAPSGRTSLAGDTRIGTFGVVASVSGNTLSTTAPLVAGSLVGRMLLPDESSASPVQIVSNTASSITIATSDMAQRTGVGRRFNVIDDQQAFETVSIESDIDVDAGALDVSGAIELSGTTSLDADQIDAGAWLARGSSQVYLRRLGAITAEQRDTSTLRIRSLTADSLALSGSSIVYGWLPTTSAIYPLHVVARELGLGAAARIDADGLGYLGSSASGNGAYGRTDGNVYASSSYYNGGSHGGLGGVYSGSVTPTFGDASAPVSAGAGGTAYPGYAGGNGGGVVRIEVAGTFTADGLVTAGGTAGPSGYAGGAGGSVWIDAGTLQRSLGGIVARANGASGVVFGAGGGGRVAAYSSARSGVSAASFEARGGASNTASRNGGAGTVRFE